MRLLERFRKRRDSVVDSDIFTHLDETEMVRVQQRLREVIADIKARKAEAEAASLSAAQVASVPR